MAFVYRSKHRGTQGAEKMVSKKLQPMIKVKVHSPPTLWAASGETDVEGLPLNSLFSTACPHWCLFISPHSKLLKKNPGALHHLAPRLNEDIYLTAESCFKQSACEAEG